MTWQGQGQGQWAGGLWCPLKFTTSPSRHHRYCPTRAHPSQRDAAFGTLMLLFFLSSSRLALQLAKEVNVCYLLGAGLDDMIWSLVERKLTVLEGSLQSGRTAFSGAAAAASGPMAAFAGAGGGATAAALALTAVSEGAAGSGAGSLSALALAPVGRTALPPPTPLVPASAAMGPPRLGSCAAAPIVIDDGDDDDDDAFLLACCSAVEAVEKRTV